MSWNQRLRMRMKHVFSRDKEDNSSDNHQASGGRGRRRKKQYRLEATRKPGQEKSLWRKLMTCAAYSSHRGQVGLASGTSPHQSLAFYLHWMFRVNFMFLFVVMCVAFFAFVILFSGFITLAGNIDAQCVRVGGKPFGSAGAPFADAFNLSWTTFR